MTDHDHDIDEVLRSRYRAESYGGPMTRCWWCNKELAIRDDAFALTDRTSPSGDILCESCAEEFVRMSLEADDPDAAAYVQQQLDDSKLRQFYYDDILGDR